MRSALDQFSCLWERRVFQGLQQGYGRGSTALFFRAAAFFSLARPVSGLLFALCCDTFSFLSLSLGSCGLWGEVCGCTVATAEKHTGNKIPEPFSRCAEPPGASNSALPLPCRMPGLSSDAVAELDQPLKNRKIHLPQAIIWKRNGLFR